MTEKSKHDPQRRRFVRTSVAATCASGVLLTGSQKAQSATEVKPEQAKTQKGYQSDSRQVQTYYERARF